MRRQECVKHRENDFRVPTPFDEVWSNLSVTNWQIPVFMCERNAFAPLTLLHRIASVWQRTVTRHKGQRRRRETRYEWWRVSPIVKTILFSVRFLRCFLLFHIVAPIVVVRWTEITLRCENDATTSQYVNRLYGSLQGLTIVWIMQQ